MAQFGGSGGSFGPNAWLVDDMYDRFLADPQSVSESWREFFADYRPGSVPAPPYPFPPPQPPSSAPFAAAAEQAAATATDPSPNTSAGTEEATPLRRAAYRIVANMEASFSNDTATS